MKGGPIGTALMALWGKLCERGGSQGNQPLSRLDDHLLDDLGITRKQADELDRHHEHQSKSSHRPN